jgi:hypothetical protein
LHDGTPEIRRLGAWLARRFADLEADAPRLVVTSQKEKTLAAGGLGWLQIVDLSSQEDEAVGEAFKAPAGAPDFQVLCR